MGAWLVIKGDVMGGTLAKANPITAPEEPLASLQDKRAMPTPVSLQK